MGRKNIPDDTLGIEGTIYCQSSALPFRFSDDKIQILLITSVKGNKWIFPKGLIDYNLSAQQSALKEAFEEAGIAGEMLDVLLGEYIYHKWGGICNVKVFPLHVKRVFKDWPESSQRQREWVPIDKAIDLIERNELKDILERFKKNFKMIRALTT